MLRGVFLTLVQYGPPVKAGLFDNSARGKAEWEVPVFGLPSYGATDKNPDVAAIARTVGAYGVRVAKAEQLTGALVDAFRQRGPALVDVVTDRVALWFPPKTSAETVAGFARSASKIVGEGGVGRVIRMARSDLPDVPRP